MRLPLGPQSIERYKTPFFRNAFFLTLSSAMMSGLGLPFWALAARSYPADAVGTAAALVSAMSIVSGLAQFGLASILVRYVPGAGLRTGTLILWSYLCAGGASIVLAVVAALTSSTWSAPLAFLATDWRWMLLFVASVLIWSIFTLEDGVLTGLSATHWVALENTLYAIAKLALVVTLASHFPNAGIFLAWTVPGIILIFPINAVIARRVRVRRRSVPQPDGPWDYRVLRSLVVGNYVGGALSVTSMFILPILIASEAGTKQAAYFYVPWTISVGVSLLVANLATSMVVEVAGAETRLAEFARKTLRLTLQFMVPVSLCLALLAPYVLTPFGDAYSDHGSAALRLLAAGATLNAVATVGVNLARIRHDGRLVAGVQGVSSVVTVGGSVVLVHFSGIDGAATAWILGQLVALLMLVPTLRATGASGRQKHPAYSE